MGYNSCLIETDVKDNDLSGLLSLLDKYQIDAWVSDRGFNANPDSEYRYSIYPITTSSFLRLEAEYADEKDVNAGDSKQSRYWYSARSDSYHTRVGRAKPDKNASNGNVWMATRRKDQEGFIYTDLRYRWPNRNGDYVRVGYELHLYQKNPPTYEGDYLWLKYRFQIANIKPDLNHNEPLLSFQCAGYELFPGRFARVATLVDMIDGKNKQDKIVFSYGDLLNTSTKDGYIEFELRVAYQDLIKANLLTSDLDNDPNTAPSPSLMKISSLSPIMYWYGNCDISLDYIEIRDQINHELHYESDMWQPGIVGRAKNVIQQGSGNVLGFYSFDEPFQGQFDSYSKVHNLLRQENISMFSATYDYQHRNIVVDPKQPQYYDHLSAFQEEVQPLIIAPDIYPITPEVKFNLETDSKNNDMFIQKVIDDKMLKIYHAGKKYTLADKNRRFYPIVQVFGRWAKGSEKDYWTSWVLPPYATQKALLLLPLCFGADGVLHYRFQSFQTADGYGDYVSLNASQKGKQYEIPVELPLTLDAIIDTNHKVSTYGKYIKQMQWLDSKTIMPTQSKAIQVMPSKTFINEAFVLNDDDAPYEGYVQCGYYLDESDNPSLMLVNRRGNYFSPLNLVNEANAPVSLYETCYPQASPQTIVIKLSKASVRRFGNYPGFFDPADSVVYSPKERVVSLAMDAGDGKLLQMIGTLPPSIDRKVKLPGKSILSGEIKLMKGAKLILSKHSDIVLLPGAKLIVSEQSSIVLDGKIELLGDSSIIMNGNSKSKSPVIKSSGNALIVDNQPPRKSFFKRLFGCK
jgi:hypothetical protein